MSGDRFFHTHIVHLPTTSRVQVILCLWIHKEFKNDEGIGMKTKKLPMSVIRTIDFQRVNTMSESSVLKLHKQILRGVHEGLMCARKREDLFELFKKNSLSISRMESHFLRFILFNDTEIASLTGILENSFHRNAKSAIETYMQRMILRRI